MADDINNGGKRTRGYDPGGVETVISVDDVERQAGELAQEGPASATLDALVDGEPANADLGVTLFVIEHNMRVVMNLAERIYCLAHGEMLAEGTPKEIQGNQMVVDAYLGAH